MTSVNVEPSVLDDVREIQMKIWEKTRKKVPYKVLFSQAIALLKEKHSAPDEGEKP